MRTREILSKIKKATKHQLRHPDYFTCWRLDECGLSEKFVRAYWNVLFQVKYGYSASVESKLKSLHSYREQIEECQRIRIFMLYWLYEMVESGEFWNITELTPRGV